MLDVSGYLNCDYRLQPFGSQDGDLVWLLVPKDQGGDFRGEQIVVPADAIDPGSRGSTPRLKPGSYEYFPNAFAAEVARQNRTILDDIGDNINAGFWGLVSITEGVCQAGGVPPLP